MCAIILPIGQSQAGGFSTTHVPARNSPALIETCLSANPSTRPGLAALIKVRPSVSVVMESQPHIPIYTSMTRLFADLGLIANDTYVIHRHQLDSFDLAKLARGGSNCPMSLSVGSAGSRPLSSVRPAASSMVTCFTPHPISGLEENSDARTSSLIGEHIDYALFGVFPSAIDRDILLACAQSDSSEGSYGAITAHNLDQRYPPRSFSPVRNALTGSGLSESEADTREPGEWHLGINHEVLHWESYVKAGYYVGTEFQWRTQNV
jgi:hypothetical protein